MTGDGVESTMLEGSLSVFGWRDSEAFPEKTYEVALTPITCRSHNLLDA